MNVKQIKAAAQWLYEAHERREPFRPLPEELAPRSAEGAYAIQDAFVALRAAKLGAISGYKIALSTAEMRRFVGVDSPQAGVVHERTIQRSPAHVRAADSVRLIVEFEIGFEVGDDLPAADRPFFRERVMQGVGGVMPALELADDRNADYSQLARHPFDLIADNCWNEGAVLGYPIKDWKGIDLAEVTGIAKINGQKVGEGKGSAAMGHPLDALSWLADHLAAHGRGLLRGDIAITGSLITSKNVKAGDFVQFALEGLGDVELRVE